MAGVQASRVPTGAAGRPGAGESSASPGTSRLYAACATIAWCSLLNALWLGFTLLGGVLFGIGPATVAACTLARRRIHGEAPRARDFARVWRAELIRGTAVMLPALAIAAIVSGNYLFFSAPGPEAAVLRLLTLAALVVLVGALAYVGPMFVHYEMPLWAYLPRAVRFALARPASTVLLLLVFAALTFASMAMPVLLVTVSVGAWLHASTWLCVRFFEENDARLSATPEPPEPRRVLPTEPLRMR